MKDAQYLKRASALTPPVPLLRNALLAFVVGGAICTIGQIVWEGFVAYGFPDADAFGPTAIVMVFLSALLTALGLYDRIAQRAGMGASLPITGFANAMVAPAMEFRTEGLVLGTGARMFQLAGPVLVYGLVTAFAAGVVLLALMGVGAA